MLRFTAFLVGVALLLSASPATAAKRLPPRPTGPYLMVTPHAARPHARITIKGIRFSPRTAIHVELDCPRLNNKRYGQQQWTARTDRKGSFTIRTRVLRPKKVARTNCVLYALVITRQSAFYRGTSFRIT